MSSQLQNKLLNYEVPPPQEVWHRIVASVEDNASLPLSQKLYQYQEEPSPAIWQNVIAQLDTETTPKSKVVPFYRRYRRPLQYSGVAAVFVFLAILTSLLISKKTESESPAEELVQNNFVRENSPKATEDSERNNTPQPEKTSKKPEAFIARASDSRNASETQHSLAFMENLLPRQAERNEMVNSSPDSDKYMIYSDDEGNVIRLPKKIFSAFACSTDDFTCRQKLQQLREKFAASATTADFTGVLQILKSLQENQ